MPDYTVSADVDSMLRSANDAAIRSAIGVGTTDAPTFLQLTLGPGTRAQPAMVFTGATTMGFWNDANSQVRLSSAGSDWLGITSGTVNIPSASTLNWGGNLFLARDADGILAQRNGVNAQAFRVANSVGASPLVDYDRGVFDFKTTTNTLRIGTENGGTYTTARPINFVTGGVTRMSIAADGLVTVNAELRANTLFATAHCLIGASNWYYWTGKGGISAPSDGVIKLGNVADDGFGRLQLGGTTSAFPAIKRNGTGIDIRLADDSAFAPVKGKITTDTAYTATTVVATGYITLYDSTGTAYRVPCAV